MNMGGLARWAVILVVVLGAAISFVIFRTYQRAGEFTTLFPRFDGECSELAGFPGSEDMVLDPETRLVYVAGEDRRALRAGQASRGEVWAVPLDAPEEAEALDLTGGVPEDFHPLGVDLFIGDDGARRLFVVNRAEAGHRLEIFRVEEGGLVHERTIADAAMRNANDVAAISADTAYVSIDKNSPTGSFGEILEGALERRTGRIMLASPDGVELAADGLIYANGIVLSEDGETLYAAETVGRALAIYDRDPASNALSRRERAFLGTGVDNVTRDAEGRLFLAAHPQMLTLARGHARDASRTSPSQVIVVDPEERRIDQIYLSDGADISGSSVAIVDVEARRMLIGSIYEPHILSCSLPETWRHSEAYPAQRPRTRDDVAE